VTTSTDAQEQKPQKPDAEPARNPLQELAAALAVEKDQSGDGGEQHPADKTKSAKPKPKSIAALAETLGVDVKELYDVEVPSSRQGEKPYTLGRLKDLAAEQDDFTVRSLSLDEDRRRLESERVRSEQELREMLQSLPADALKPEMVEKRRAAIKTKQQQEHARLLDTVPEWRDEQTRLAELTGIAEHLNAYDIPESFLLLNFDHRLMRYVRENWQRKQRLEAALARVQERKPVTQAKSQKQDAQRTQRRASATAPSREQQQVGAFMDIIRQAGQRQ
jgi:hypothetical protein